MYPMSVEIYGNSHDILGDKIYRKLSNIVFNLYNHKNEHKKMIADDQKADASYSKRSGLLRFPG